MSDNSPELVQSVAEGVDRDFRRLLVATGCLIVLSGAILVYVLGFLQPEQQRYGSGSRALQLAHEAMLDQETGLRGYLLVNDTRFLQPYRQGVAALASENAALTRYFGSDSSVASLLLDMRVAQQAWLSEWALAVAAGRAPAGRSALDAFLFRGKALFDAYRVKELALSDRVEANRESIFNRQGIAFAIGLGGVVALALVLVVAMVRQRGALSRGVVAPVAAIVAATEVIADGDLDLVLTPSGASEFRRIGESINVMREALGAARLRERVAQQVIETQSGQLREILEMSREIAGSLNLRYVMQTMAAAATRVSGLPRATVWLTDEEDATSLNAMFDTLNSDRPPAAEVRAEVGIGVVGQAVRYGRITMEAEAADPSVQVDPDRPVKTVAVPLVVGAQVRGAIELTSPTPHQMTEGSLEILQTLASHAAAAIEAARLHSKTEELAQTDGLTGLANRRRLDGDLTAECDRSARYERPLALIMFDVDHFKQFNDTFGHLRGDEALQELAATVRREIRATDTAYRYGGEEFAVLARETDADHAIALAERLRTRIEEHFAARGTLAPITASFGVGPAPPEQPIPESMLANADAALYRAKSDGRNRVRGPEPLAPEALPDV
jgi:diguanylate cyclase (GGDEF)-like protein